MEPFLLWVISVGFVSSWWRGRMRGWHCGEGWAAAADASLVCPPDPLSSTPTVSAPFSFLLLWYNMGNERTDKHKKLSHAVLKHSEKYFLFLRIISCLPNRGEIAEFKGLECQKWVSFLIQFYFLCIFFLVFPPICWGPPSGPWSAPTLKTSDL